MHGYSEMKGRVLLSKSLSPDFRTVVGLIQLLFTLCRPAFWSMPCNYLPCFSDTSLHFLPANEMIAAVFCQAEDHSQKRPVKSPTPSPYCLSTEFRRATPAPCICLHGRAGLVSLFRGITCFRPESLIRFLTFCCCCFARGPCRIICFKPSLRLCPPCEGCRKSARILKFHINC